MGCQSENQVDEQERKVQERMASVKQVIVVMSGKGGVGKSLVTGLLASALARAGYRVGVLDADVTGPSIPKLFGAHGPLMGGPMGIEPVESRTGIKLMSVNFLLGDEEQAVIWRGPLISSAISNSGAMYIGASWTTCW